MKRPILATAVAHACYVIGHEWQTQRQRDAVWKHVRPGHLAKMHNFL